MNKKSVSLWCEDVSGYYSLKPIIQKYQLKDYIIYVYVLEKNIKFLKNYIKNLSNIEIISIESINNFWLKCSNFIFRNFLTNPNYTDMYFKQIKKKAIFKNYHKYLGNFFYLDNPKINTVFQNFFSNFTNKLKSNFLISISRVKASHLICSKNIKHVSIMESWDHPVKSPYWHVPNIILTWNLDLKKDFKKYQNFNDVKIFFIKPLKFRYIDNKKKKKLANLENNLKNVSFKRDIFAIKDKDVFMYIATTSSLRKNEHIGEMKLIDQLCQACQKIGKILYIKPKPNGPKGDYDLFSKKYKNVIVGTYANNTNSIDMLSEEYHTFRFLLLYYSKLIINVGTTFVLEAALLDKPILQLNLLKNDFGSFADASKNPHITKYLLNKNSYKIKTHKDIFNILSYNKEIFYSSSKNLKEWISHNV